MYVHNVYTSLFNKDQAIGERACKGSSSNNRSTIEYNGYIKGWQFVKKSEGMLLCLIHQNG